MKTNPFLPVLAAFAALLLFVAGCNAPTKTENAAEASAMTPTEKQAIETENFRPDKGILSACRKVRYRSLHDVF